VREEADGNFVIATSRGLARYQPPERAPAESRASVVLTSIMLGGEERRMTEVPEVASSGGTLAGGIFAAGAGYAGAHLLPFTN